MKAVEAREYPHYNAQCRGFLRWLHIGKKCSLLLLSWFFLPTISRAFAAEYWIRDWQEVTPALVLPVTATETAIPFPETLMKFRLQKSESDPRIEGLTLKVPLNREKLIAYAQRFAAPGKTKALTFYLLEHVNRQRLEGKTPVATFSLEVEADLVPLLNPLALAAPNQFEHQRLQLVSEAVRNDESLRTGLLEQLEYFLEPGQIEEFNQQLLTTEEIDVEAYLLPDFARKVVGRFAKYQGLNCFHAALNFQHPFFTRSPFFNVSKEKDHHRLMVNSDEFLRVLESNFYQLPRQASQVKYGDILVFFDLPADATAPLHYSWVKHAAVYLLGNYVFSKGSKSSYTPYIIKHLSSEWAFWQGKTKNLGIKIFRRYGNYVTKHPSPNRIDWLY